MAFAARAAELRVVARGGTVGTRALRELLALQASDWAFLTGTRGGGPVRARAPRGPPGRSSMRALASGGDDAVRNLAPNVTLDAPLLAP